MQRMRVVSLVRGRAARARRPERLARLSRAAGLALGKVWSDLMPCTSVSRGRVDFRGARSARRRCGPAGAGWQTRGKPLRGGKHEMVRRMVISMWAGLQTGRSTNAFDAVASERVRYRTAVVSRKRFPGLCRRGSGVGLWISRGWTGPRISSGRTAAWGRTSQHASAAKHRAGSTSGWQASHTNDGISVLVVARRPRFFVSRFRRARIRHAAITICARTRFFYGALDRRVRASSRSVGSARRSCGQFMGSRSARSRARPAAARGCSTAGVVRLSRRRSE